MTRGWLPQRAGLPSLNGSRDAAAVAQKKISKDATYTSASAALGMTLYGAYHDHQLSLHVLTKKTNIIKNWNAMTLIGDVIST